MSELDLGALADKMDREEAGQAELKARYPGGTLVRQTTGLAPEDIERGASFFQPKFCDGGRSWEIFASDYDAEIMAGQNAEQVKLVSDAIGPTPSTTNELRSATGRKKK